MRPEADATGLRFAVLAATWNEAFVARLRWVYDAPVRSLARADDVIVLARLSQLDRREPGAPQPKR